MTDHFDTLVEEAEKEAKAMQGWDFSYIKDRRHSDLHPWDYNDAVCSRLDGVRDMLDMDTGGGEVLLGLKEDANTWPDYVCAIEGYRPNVSVATHNLQSIGAKVLECKSDGKLPFADESFGLITNRHGNYSAQEIKRVLRPSGLFITQQIRFGTKTSLNTLLDGPDTAPIYNQASFAELISQFEKLDLEIVDQREFKGSDVFDDIGAVVFTLTAAAWELPGFSVERYREQLYKLHESIRSNGPIDVGISFYLIVVRKRV
ncbi:MAG: methyltransferase domain-containing protein [Gammaproteobacteria bacterium]|nr:methyltransferase domain-containing protein [Gammaproteobacteria bacterium]